MAPHEKLFVDKDWLSEDIVHGSIACTNCHGGDPSEPDWRKAHTNLMKDPSWENLEASCGLCHADIADVFQNSLHATLSPYKRAIDLRANPDPDIRREVDMARQTHCMSCHASCGQCHISRPDPVEGGLLQAHFFKKRPPMREVCTSCHGSRIDLEYFGKNEGIPPDVHRQKFLKCGDCHTAEEMHGDGNDYYNRHTVANRPRCTDCHESIYSDDSENSMQHLIHQDRVSCQVCHAMPYKNCYSCHVGKDSLGLNYFKTEPSVMDLKIGLNPLQSDDRPEKFVTVRHIPVDHELFAYYVDNGLSRFDNAPTWKLSTSHTIQRNTPQNESCDSCHGNRDIFLQESDVRPEYLKANHTVIVPIEMIPQKIGQ